MTNRDAINLLEEVKILDDTMYAYNPKYLDALDMALNALEAEERKTGEWIVKKKLVPLPRDCEPFDWDNYDKDTHSEWENRYYCSECDWESGKFRGGKFCSNCGARMLREGEDNG